MSGSPRHHTPPAQTGTPNKGQSTPHRRTPTNEPVEEIFQKSLPQRIPVTELPYPDKGSPESTEHAGPSTSNNLDDAIYTSTSTVIIQPVESSPSIDEFVRDLPQKYVKSDQETIELENYLMPFLQQEITLPEFLKLFGPYTVDKGYLLCQVADDEIYWFESLVKQTFDNQEFEMTNIMVEQNIVAVKKYADLTSLMKMQTDEVLEAIKLFIPDFDWNDYKNNPNYLQDYFSSWLEERKASKISIEKKDVDGDMECIKTLQMITVVEEDLKDVEAQEEEMMNTLAKLRKERTERQMESSAEVMFLQEKNMALRNNVKELRTQLRELQSERFASLAAEPQEDDAVMEWDDFDNVDDDDGDV